MKPGQRFIPYKMFNGIFIPNVLLESALLSPAEMIVYGRLCQFGGENGFCYPSLSTIATKTSISRSGAIKSINSLVENGFIEKQVPGMASLGQQCTNQYYFLLHPVFLDAFRPPSPQSELGQRPSAQSGLPPVHSVDQPSLQSRPKEIHKENHKKTTTTTTTSSEEAMCSEELSRSCGFSLSEKQALYIELKVKRTIAEGEIRKSSERLKFSLVRKAMHGQLDMSDFDELVRWGRIKKNPPISDNLGLPNIQREKEELHYEMHEKSQRARAWWERVSADHPAKREEKPSIYPEEFWIRTQYSKYELGGCQ